MLSSSRVFLGDCLHCKDFKFESRCSLKKHKISGETIWVLTCKQHIQGKNVGTSRPMNRSLFRQDSYKVTAISKLFLLRLPEFPEVLLIYSAVIPIWWQLSLYTRYNPLSLLILLQSPYAWDSPVRSFSNDEENMMEKSSNSVRCRRIHYSSRSERGITSFLFTVCWL